MPSRSRTLGVLLAAALSTFSALAVDYDSVDFFRAVNVDNDGAVARMLAAGVDPNQLDPRGQPALIVALQGQSMKVARLLWDAKGIQIDQRNHAGETPLMMAARYGNEEAVDALLAAGADRTARNDLGMDASAFAASAGRDRLAARLKPSAAK